MANQLPKSQKVHTDGGFTIIETLIVLAIAGMILLIVFLAIPVLQRNSRNNQRKQDVALVLAAVSHYELNNSGTFPGPCGRSGDAKCNESKNEPLFYSSLKFYDVTAADSVVIVPQDVSASVGNPGDPEKVAVYNHQKCDTSSIGRSTSQGAAYNDVVALYTLEGGSGPIAQCREL